jgi:hypothetical protein
MEPRKWSEKLSSYSLSYLLTYPGETPMLKLDFSIESSADRAAYVNTYIDPCANYTAKELETISNYLLYGKDEDGLSCVDKKQVQIKAKHSTWARKDAESLDALLEKPTFDERGIQSGNTRYKNPKPSIDRIADADVPGIQDLWKVIDEVQYLIDVNKGKIEDTNVRKLTSNELYEYQHYLVELRRQQFVLRDAVKPVLCRSKVNITPVYDMFDAAIPWDQENSNFAIAPLGLYTYAKQRFDDPRALEEVDYHWNENAKWVLDFRNADHIYELFELWDELETAASLDVESTAAAMLDTLKFYRMRAHLTEEQEKILDMKIAHVPNQTISDKVRELYGTAHSANYISTMYKQKICGKIAEAAILHFDYYQNREIANAWKKCTCCGEYKLRDTREYMRRARSSDGLASICKVCDKEKREKMKRGEK